MSYVLVSFETPHHTIKADKALAEVNIVKVVYPIPREISRDCGMGIRLLQADLEQALQLFTEKGILYKHVFPVDGRDKVSLLDRLVQKDQHSS